MACTARAVLSFGARGERDSPLVALTGALRRSVDGGGAATMAMHLDPAALHSQGLALNLLDGARAVDRAAHAAIDGALRRRTGDRSVHAAAMLLAFRAGDDLGLERSAAKRWILGLDELIDAGHIDAAAYAVPHLHRAFPKMAYLEYMALVFRRLPAVVDGGRPVFVDDRGRDVQVVPLPGADTLILAFCGMGHRLGLSLSLIDRWFGELGCHVVYLRDRRRVGFSDGIPALGPDLATSIDALQGLARGLGARRLVCAGNSAGATGALRYAKILGAERVLALAPITGGQEYEESIAPHLQPGEVMPWTDLVPVYRDESGVSARILYGAHNDGDRRQSQRMAGLPGVTVEAIADWESHHLIGGLLRAQRLQRVLWWLTAETDAPVVEPVGATTADSAAR